MGLKERSMGFSDCNSPCRSNTKTMDTKNLARRHRLRPQCVNRAVLVALVCTTWYYFLAWSDAFQTPLTPRRRGETKTSTSSLSFRHFQRTQFSLWATPRQSSAASSGAGGENGARRRRRKSRLKASPSSLPVKNGLRQTTKLQKEKVTTVTEPKNRLKTMASFRYESLRHSLLTKQEELRLGRQLRRALQVQQKVDELLERKELQRLERLQAESLDEDVFTMEEELEDFLWRTQRTSESRQTQSGHYIRDYDMFDDDGRIRGFDEDDDEDDLLGLSVYGINEANALQEFDSRSVVTRGSNSFGIADIALSDQEIREHLGIDGGHKELSKILVEGALAKEQMIKCNIRLVMNIARKWMTRSNIGGDSNKAYVLMGSWTKPSLDEVVQEGILGLAKAAERFDPERNLKFSTYATYYITNEVRLAFQRATTGCLRVPSNYILIRNKYEKLVKEHYQQTGKGLDLAVAAEKLQYPMERLNFILRSTRPLLQLDGPVPMALASSAGKAGSNLGSYGVPPSFADTLECMEPSPEAVLERSLLRQCLENALANELSPHERDVLRLRHGLDDGVSRSVKEVVESCGGMMSPAEIRRAEFRAYSKLRTPTSLHNRRLLGFAAEFASFDPSESLEAY